MYYEKSSDLPKRKPDRAYGLRRTKNFEDALDQPALAILDEAHGEYLEHVKQRTESISKGDGSRGYTVQDLVQATPFHRLGEPLLFPFLVMEAKSEPGEGFASCGIQTALPILDLLNGQSKLEERAGQGLEEQGGPFVWYLAYRGDTWRLSGCCTVPEKDRAMLVSKIAPGKWYLF